MFWFKHECSWNCKYTVQLVQFFLATYSDRLQAQTVQYIHLWAGFSTSHTVLPLQCRLAAMTSVIVVLIGVRVIIRLHLNLDLWHGVGDPWDRGHCRSRRGWAGDLQVQSDAEERASPVIILPYYIENPSQITVHMNHLNPGLGWPETLRALYQSLFGFQSLNIFAESSRSPSCNVSWDLLFPVKVFPTIWILCVSVGSKPCFKAMQT